MKIIITENQYRKLLSENFDYSDSDSLSAIENDDELYNIFLGKILSGYFINSYHKDKNNMISIFDYVVERHSISLFKNRKDVINNFYKLLNLKLKLP